MARIPDAFIDDLLARTDIVEVIGARVPLKRQGKEFASRCPFHDERSPSFTVSPTKQFYHCFGCGAHGTAISFLMNYDRLEFLDAVDELAKRVGMEVPRDTQQTQRKPRHAATCSPRSTPRRSSSSKHLAGSDKAKAYVEQRGIDAGDRRALTASATRPTASTRCATRSAPTSAACSCSNAAACSRRTTRATSTTSSAIG